MPKTIPSILLACFLLVGVAPCGQAEDNTAKECLKGTVAKVAETELYLQSVTFSDPSLGFLDAMVILDEETRYYDGTRMISRSEIESGNIVLAYYETEGKLRKATLVRVIGGKKR